MNNYRTLDINYLRSSRTVETVLVSNKKFEKLFFVYNFEGWYFRVFDSELGLTDFFMKDIESEICFEKETELDVFFQKVELHNRMLS
jgi:hypothetical protein